MQIPKTGTSPRMALALSTAQGAAEGSPGPLLKKTPSGFIAITSEAGVFAGTTVTLQPENNADGTCCSWKAYKFLQVQRHSSCVCIHTCLQVALLTHKRKSELNTSRSVSKSHLQIKPVSAKEVPRGYNKPRLEVAEEPKNLIV